MSITSKHSQVTVATVAAGKSAISTKFGRTVLLMQAFSSTYASAGNSKTNNIFDATEFNGKTFTSLRYAFIPIPSNATEDTVNEQLSKFPSARIYREMSCDIMDLLTDEQKHNVGNGRLQLNDLKNKMKAMQYKSDTDRTLIPNLYNGQEFYRATFFDATGKVEDKDMRADSLVRMGVNTPSVVTATVPSKTQDAIQALLNQVI
jgi:hypothetical protein